MITREEAIRCCLGFPGVYEDQPFHDDNWTVIRHRQNNKIFAAVFDRQGHVWINVKCHPAMTFVWRQMYPSVIPAYHMNKEHWNSIILDGTVPVDAIESMIADSYHLTKVKR